MTKDNKPSATMEKANQRVILKRLLAYLLVYKFQVIGALITGLVGVFLTVMSPKILGQATNVLFSGLLSAKLIKAGFRPGIPKSVIIKLLDQHGLGSIAGMVQAMPINLTVGMDWTKFTNILLSVIVIYLVAFLFRIIENYLLARVIASAVYDIRRDVEFKINHLPVAYFDRMPRGQVMSTIVNDVDNMTSSLQQILGQMIFSTFMLIGVIYMMVSISWQLTLVSLASIPVIVLTVRGIVKVSQPNFQLQWKQTGRVHSYVEEIFSGMEVIRAYGQQSVINRRFDGDNTQLCQASYKAQMLSGLINPIGGFVGNLVFVAVVIISGLQVIHGSLTIGNFQALSQYTRQIQRPINQLASMSNNVQSTFASADRLFQFLDATNEEEKVVSADCRAMVTDDLFAQDITFSHVRFSYQVDKPLITDMSFTIPCGHMTALVGPTGAGKTTIINLVMQFYRHQEGDIYIGGVNIHDIPDDMLRDHVGMVTQNTWLFNGTIRENLMYGVKDPSLISEERFRMITRMMHVDDFVSALPDQYDTVLDADSNLLSQGECQLLTICRAFLADPMILILDEATSSVDVYTERFVQQAMDILCQGRTSIVIAHRLSTIVNAKQILVIDHGAVCESGAHHELLQQNGMYAELYNSQFENGVDNE